MVTDLVDDFSLVFEGMKYEVWNILSIRCIKFKNRFGYSICKYLLLASVSLVIDHESSRLGFMSADNAHVQKSLPSPLPYMTMRIPLRIHTCLTTRNWLILIHGMRGSQRVADPW